MADVEDPEEQASPQASRSRGETRRLLRHLQAVKGRREDNSKDQEWKVSGCLMATDCYVVFATLLWLVPKTVLLTLPLFAFALPACLMARLYGCCLKAGQERVTGRCRLTVLVTPAAVPFVFLACVSLLLDYFIYYVLSLPVFVLRCLACQARICGSYGALKPYRGGPWIFWYLTDLWVALVGQVLRHGVLESSLKMAMTLLYVPWLKYFVNCNPLLYNLDERFVQQISTSTQDMKTADVVSTMKRLVNRAKDVAEVRTNLDAARFVPHYPYPPPSRDFALGLQAGGNAFYTSFLATHTTHVLVPESSRPRTSDYFVLSNSCEIPVWRVVLWYNNPFHFFTGYVEAGISNGKPSQPDKHLGIEHPMWLVTARSPLLSDRNSNVGPGFVDRFFDEWFPDFVTLLRIILRGPEAAVELHQQVHSEDGISRPKPIIDKTGGKKKKKIVHGRVVVDDDENLNNNKKKKDQQERKK